jgi:hypothetical protein
VISYHRSTVALLLIGLACPALAQSPGTFVGTSANPKAPPPSAPTFYAFGAMQADSVNGLVSRPTIDGGSVINNLLPSGTATHGLGGRMQELYETAWTPTCPAANCPGPATSAHVIKSKTIFNGNSTDPHHPSWLIQGSLFNSAGDTDAAAQHVTAYFGQVQGTHAGGGWTLNTDIVRCGGTAGWDGTVGGGAGTGADRCTPGTMTTTSATIGYELDYSNWDQTAGIGIGPFTPGMFISTLSSFTSLAGIFYGAGTGQVVPSWDEGIYFGPNTVKSNTVFDGSSSTFSYQAAGRHSVAFYDNSASTYGLQINGTHNGSDIWLTDAAAYGVQVAGAHSSADILLGDNAPIALNITGVHSSADVGDTSTSPIAFNVGGTHASGTIVIIDTSPAAISVSGTHNIAITSGGDSAPYSFVTKAGQKICMNGFAACAWYDATAHKWYFTDENDVIVFSIAAITGNAIFKGTVTSSGTP